MAVPSTLTIVAPQVLCLTVKSHLQAEMLCLLSRWIQGHKLDVEEFGRIKEMVEFTETEADGLVHILRLESC